MSGGKQISDFEQIRAEMAEISKVAADHYANLINDGMPEDKAFSLVKDYHMGAMAKILGFGPPPGEG